MLWVLFIISTVFGNRLYDLQTRPNRRLQKKRRLRRYFDEYAVGGEDAPPPSHHPKQKHRRKNQKSRNENQVSGLPAMGMPGAQNSMMPGAQNSMMPGGMQNSMQPGLQMPMPGMAPQMPRMMPQMQGMMPPMAGMSQMQGMSATGMVSPIPQGCPKIRCQCNRKGTAMMQQATSGMGGLNSSGMGGLGGLGRRRLMNPPRSGGRRQRVQNGKGGGFRTRNQYGEDQVGFLGNLFGGGKGGRNRRGRQGRGRQPRMSNRMSPQCQQAQNIRCNQMCAPCTAIECQGFPRQNSRFGGIGRRNLFLSALKGGLTGLTGGTGALSDVSFDRGYDCRLGWCRVFCKKTAGGMQAGGQGGMPMGMPGGMPMGRRTNSESEISESGNDYAQEYGRQNRHRSQQRGDLDYAETALGDFEEEPFYFYDDDEEEVGVTGYDWDHAVQTPTEAKTLHERPLSKTEDMSLEEMIQDLLDSEQMIKHSLSNHRRANKRQRD